MNNLMKKLALTVAVATAITGSIEAQAINPYGNFEALQQAIECFRKPGTDYLYCTNKIVDSEEEDTTPEPVVVTPEPEGNQWFSEPVDIVIPEFYWPLISEKVDGPHIEFVDAMDFDRDGLMDLVLFTDVNRGRYWGEAGPGPLYHGNGEETFDDIDGASWASEVFLRQTEPGVYEIWNYELFGEDFINPGGLSRRRVLEDFNGDGYPDLVRSQAREDGRRQTQLSGIRGTDTEDLPYLDNWMSQQKAYMSNGDGTYRMEDLGDLVMWAHAITSAKNENGDWDIVFGSYDNDTNKNPFTGPANAFTFQGDYQQEYGDYPHLGSWDIVGSLPVDVGNKNYSEYLIDTVTFQDANNDPYAQGYRVFEQVNGKFEFLTELELSTIVDTIDVYFSDRNTPAGMENIRPRDVWEHRGMRLVNHNFSHACSLMLNENESVFVSTSDGAMIPEDWDYNQPIYPDELKRHGISLIAWKIEDGEVVILDEIFDEQKEVPVVGHMNECKDINGDGLHDYMAPSTGRPLTDYLVQSPEVGETSNTLPLLYINNGKGDLVYTPIKGKDEIEFLDHRVHPEFGSGIKSYITDINGDGIGDFVHFQYGKDTLRIQYGLKPQQ